MIYKKIHKFLINNSFNKIMIMIIINMEDTI